MFNLFGNKKEAKLFPEITGDTIVGDVLDMDETTAPYFQEIGMHCLGCPASAVHGVDAKALIEKLNVHLGNKA